ncbi:MAG: glycogen/starch synthase, partial [Deltaproteobacteria bacterium]|nr:glycogen/starch synthase [Deltaproteobacteria bacterium]
MPGPVVLHVASERHPLVKTGGLADVVGALPAAQRRAGLDARVLLPGYPRVLAAATHVTEIARCPTLPGGASGRLLELTLHDAEVPTYALEAHALYDRPGGPYVDEHGSEHGDNAERFAALGWA